MSATYVVHIIAGSIALIAGYVALYASKGAPLHRRAGMAFVWSMLAMCAAGTLIAAVKGVAPKLNIPMGCLTAYLVFTSLTTVRPPKRGWRAWHLGSMALGSGVVIADMTFGITRLARGRPIGAMWLTFGVIALLALIGDVRVLRSGPLRGSMRLARHLWRMTFALLIAALSFFIGQQQVIPQSVRIPALLAMPVVAVFVTLLYWMWKVRVRQSLRGMVLQPALPRQ